MYTKGDIEIGKLWSDARWEDSDEGNDENDHILPHPYEGKKVIELPHSCDSWVVGGEKEARQMIEDLEEAIKKLK